MFIRRFYEKAAQTLIGNRNANGGGKIKLYLYMFQYVYVFNLIVSCSFFLLLMVIMIICFEFLTCYCGYGVIEFRLCLPWIYCAQIDVFFFLLIVVDV